MAMGPFQVGLIGRAESELAVQAVSVGRMQAPPEVGTRATVDDRANQLFSQTSAPGFRQDVDVCQIGEAHAVRNRSCEADHTPSLLFVSTDDAPGRCQLRVEVGARPPATPVRLCRQEVPSSIPVDPSSVVVQLVALVLSDHGRNATDQLLLGPRVMSRTGSLAVRQDR